MRLSDEFLKIFEEIENSIKYSEDFDNGYYEDIIDMIINKNVNILNLIYELIYVANHEDFSIFTPVHRNLDKVFEDLFDMNNMSFESKNYKLSLENHCSSYLNSEKSDIIDFINQNLDLKYNNMLVDMLSTIKIKFSDSRCFEGFGTYNISDITQSINDFFNKYPNVNKHLKSILTTIQAALKENIQPLTKEICRKISEIKNQLPPQVKSDLDILIKKIKSLRFSVPRLGEFKYKNLSITLYTEAIFKHSLKNKVSFKKSMLSVFAHELFHAYHYLIIGDNNEWQECPKIIKESFASYFQYIFNNEYSLDVFDLEKEWKTHDMLIYPYSGAQYIKENIFNKLKPYINTNIDSIKMPNFANTISINFAELFKLSLIDSNSALQVFKLFYSYDNI